MAAPGAQVPRVLPRLLCLTACAGAAASDISWVRCPVMTYAAPEERAPAALRDVAAALRAEGALPRPGLPRRLPEGFRAADVISECALVPAPLDHSDPGAGAVELFVKRLRPAGGEAGRALWLLPGGPGDSSADDVEPIHALLFDRLGRGAGSFEVLVTDHRGVGRSARLGCRRSQAESPGSPGGIGITVGEYAGCLQDLALDYPGGRGALFSAESAARDLNLLIERMRRPGQSVDVYGISYGTYWAGRYLRLFPDQARAAVLDGVVGASGALFDERLTFERWDLKLDRVGRHVLARCGEDAFCQQRLGRDAVGRLRELYARLRGGACHGPLSLLGGVDSLKILLGSLLYGWSGRGTATALIFRLLRCSDADARAIAHLAGVRDNVSSLFPVVRTGRAEPQGVPLRSEVLFRNVMLSELWDASATAADLRRWFNDSLFAIDVFADMPTLRSTWPVYEPAAGFNTTLASSAHLLYMNGDTDPQTPLWSARWEYESANSSSSKSFITWAGATHFSILNTPVAGGGDPCGLQAVVAFLARPGAGDEARLECRRRLRPVDFAGDPDVNLLLWGTPDAYGAGGPGGPGGPGGAYGAGGPRGPGGPGSGAYGAGGPGGAPAAALVV